MESFLWNSPRSNSGIIIPVDKQIVGNSTIVWEKKKIEKRELYLKKT